MKLRGMVTISIDGDEAVCSRSRVSTSWDVRDPANAIILSLHHEQYKQLIIEVENPAEAIARLQKAIAQTQG